METRLLKQVAGIDVAQKELVVSLGCMDEQAVNRLYAYKTFSNNEKGFMALEMWVKKQTDEASALRFVMEATGVYHEALAYFLSVRACSVSIVMPNKITSFFKTLDIKTVTDKSMSQAITLFGLEKTLDTWVPPQPVFRQLRQLTRERDQLTCERTVLKNQLHAEQAEAYPGGQTIQRIQERIKMTNRQLAETMLEIKAAIKTDAALAKDVALLTTVPGIGLLTAAVILAETRGFELIRNASQLASYAGFDVSEKESGTSVKGKPRISKRGNRHLRKAMHMPALAAIRHSPRYKALFVRLVARSGIKMKAAVAVQRKLLEVTYTIFKTKKPFKADYLQTQQYKKAELKEVLINS